MSLFASGKKTISDMSDKELIKFIEKPPFGTSAASRAKAIEEAIARGLTNPKTGEAYHY